MAALHAERFGAGPRLVLVHGFTQTGRSWGELGDRLAATRSVVAVDLPGHGGSSWVRAGLWEAGALVAEAAGDGPFDLLGYSLGARVALHAALARPAGLRRLVLVGATGGIEDPAARDARRARDEAMADELERSGDLEGFLARWVALPMFASLPDPGLAERRRNTPEGLASSLRLCGVGVQAPLWDRLGELLCPVLALAGAADSRFARHAARLAGEAARGAFSLVPGAGHAAGAERPALVARLVGSFLA